MKKMIVLLLAGLWASNAFGAVTSKNVDQAREQRVASETETKPPSQRKPALSGEFYCQDVELFSPGGMAGHLNGKCVAEKPFSMTPINKASFFVCCVKK